MRNKGIIIASASILFAVPLGSKIQEHRVRAGFRDKVANLQVICSAQENSSNGADLDQRRLLVPVCKPLSETELNMRLAGVNCTTPTIPLSALITFQQAMRTLADDSVNLAASLDCGDMSECLDYHAALYRAAKAYRQQYQMIAVCLSQQEPKCREFSEICSDAQFVCSLRGVSWANGHSCEDWQIMCRTAGEICHTDGPN